MMRQPSSRDTRLVETPPERAGGRVFEDSQALALGALLRDASISLDFSRPFFDLGVGLGRQTLLAAYSGPT